ncbi:MAG: metal-sensing transcriptional repressor [Oscillospiraceae bacterium]|nr:metal-sensing transcriptional repressor [Oscillospiraceae bacterium]
MTNREDCPACAKQTLRTDELKRKLLNRLRRIEGQVRGIEAMIESDAYCNDVLTQSAAVTAALDAFNRELLACHIRGCVKRDLLAGDESVVDELVETIRKLMK